MAESGQQIAIVFSRKLDRKRSKNFGDRVRLGLGIEKAVEREAGRARRGQDGAKIGPCFFVVWQKSTKESFLVSMQNLKDLVR